MSYLKDIVVFVKVVERKGFAAASRELGLSPPSVSKQIARLEAELGVVLIHRTTHTLFLTEAGRELYEHSVKGLAEIEAARKTAMSFNEELKGTLRIHTTTSVGQSLIAPALVGFMTENPGIRVRLKIGPVLINPIEGQYDVSFRTKPKREKSPGNVSIGRRILGDVYQTVVASPAYLARAGTPTTIHELLERDCLVHVTQSTDEHWTFATPTGDVTLRIDPVLRSNNWSCVREAALEGLGIGRLPEFAIRQQLADGTLVPLFAQYRRSDQQVQALYPLTQRMPAKLRLLLDYLADRISPAQDTRAFDEPGGAEPRPPAGSPPGPRARRGRIRHPTITGP